MMKLYHDTCYECSQLITQRYSTSFSMGIRVFDHKFRVPIYAIYGFVRFADEIVDTFHDFPKGNLLERFREDTYRAIEEKISLNPVLNAFQLVVHNYDIERDLIDAFLDSMAMDLHKHNYQDQLYRQYMKSDFDERGRVYFPGVDFSHFTNKDKQQIEADIKADFDHGYEGIVQLPKGARFGVYLAYVYYTNLFKKIKRATAAKVTQERIRVNDSKKVYLLFSSALKNALNLL